MDLANRIVVALGPVFALLNVGLIFLNIWVCRRGFRIADRSRVEHTFSAITRMQMDSQRSGDIHAYRSLFWTGGIVFFLTIASIHNISRYFL